MPGEALVILGCGWIARRHATAARRLHIPAIFASRDLARARAYAREFHGIDAVGTYADALADRRAHAVVVCTPHDRHLADTLAALTAGKHVLVEKPIARTLDEADRMISAARAAGRVLMVAENFHYRPAFRRVQQVLGGGGVGSLRELQLIARVYRRHTDWRCDGNVMGGGALIDGGIHYVHNLRWWAGHPRRVFALRPPQTLTNFAGEDAISFLAECSGGVLCVVTTRCCAPSWMRSATAKRRRPTARPDVRTWPSCSRPIAR